MRKVALVFALAVVLPSLALAWLAVRSLHDQELVLERQQAALAQGLADQTARLLRESIDAERSRFASAVESLLKTNRTRDLIVRFDDQIRGVWAPAEVGFVVSLEGAIQCPSLFERPVARQFRLDNDQFLCNREPVSVVWPEARPEDPRGKETAKSKDPGSVFATKARSVAPPPPAPPSAPAIPGWQEPVAATNTPARSGFRDIVGDSTDGTVARFVQDQLNLLFWYRPVPAPQQVFGALVNLDQLIARLRRDVPAALAGGESFTVSIDDDRGHSLFRRPEESPAPGPRPLATAEIGQMLPHWLVAVQLRDPGRITATARSVRLTLGLLIGLLVLAIGVGSWLIVTDLRRQLTRARQQRDFVSNVSHELKTPLTNIRLFAEMLAEQRVADPARQQQFLGIITSEASRLTRLINNVLDFARLERGHAPLPAAVFDLRPLVEETLASCRPPLAAAGFSITTDLPATPVQVRGDRDALARVLVNLLSNAEKYSGDRREITVRVAADPAGGRARVEVLDRGLGVPTGLEERIFDEFFRAHDSLASEVGGAGLGLTLARQIARTHGGDLACTAREGGGSVFTLTLPVHSA